MLYAGGVGMVVSAALSHLSDPVFGWLAGTLVMFLGFVYEVYQRELQTGKDSSKEAYHDVEDDTTGSRSSHPGWVCGGCGKHVTGSIPRDQCVDCGGRWFVATERDKIEVLEP